MFKRLSRRMISVILTLCLILSIVSVGVVSASSAEANVAATGNPIMEKVWEQLIDDGLRAICMSMDALSDATGNETDDEVFSVIEKWAFMSTTEVAVEEVKEMCEEILEQIEELSTHMDSNDTYIEQMEALDTATNAYALMDEAWRTDVTQYMSDESVIYAKDKYMDYLTDAVNGASEAQLISDRDQLIAAFETMGTSSPSVFVTDSVNDRFIKLINNLLLGFTPQSDTDLLCSDYAAQAAYRAYPFSHMQYQYIHTVVAQQIINVILVEMMYNEYLYQQGLYLDQMYPDEDPEDITSHHYQYNGFLQTFYDVMNDVKHGVNVKIYNYLNHKMNVDGSHQVELTLDDFMKPEDAVTTTMTINGYETSHNATNEWRDYFNYDDYENIGSGDSNVTYPKYIEQTVKFNKVMTHTPDGSHVYYILDPEQYAGTDALFMLNMDHCVVVDFGGDIHTESCDYRNLCKEMSDGANTFVGITDKSCPGLSGLIQTNYFALKGNTLQAYLNEFNEYAVRDLNLNPHKYLPDESTNPVNKDSGGTAHNFVLTSKYELETNVIATCYETIKLLDCERQFADGSLVGDYSMDMDHGHTSRQETVTAILRNTGDSFLQNAHAEINNANAGEIQISADEVHYSYAGESQTAAPGTKITVKMKATDGKMTALKMIRNHDAVSGSTDSTYETVLLDEYQLSEYTPDADGYITAQFTMPYSDTTFRLEVDDTYAKAEIVSDTGGKATFEDGSTVQYCKKNEPCTVYVDPDNGCGIFSVELLDKHSNYICDIPVDLSKKRAEGEDAYTFTMGSENVKVKVHFDVSNTIRIDTSTFSYDENGNKTEYLYFADDPDAESRAVCKGCPVRFKAVYDRGIHEVVVPVGKGVTSGNEYGFSFENDTYTLGTLDEDIVVSVSFSEHNYVNGFCTECGQYETPELGENGFYQIKNGGNLFWIAAMTRDDHTHASFDESYLGANFELVNDIDLESRQWEQFTTRNADTYFTGIFEGNGFTINNYYYRYEVTDPYDRKMELGMFYGTGGAKIQNFSIKGKAELYYPAFDGVDPDDAEMLSFSTIAYEIKDTDISHVFSYVDITVDGAPSMYTVVSGLVFTMTGASNVRGCVNFGNITGRTPDLAGLIIYANYLNGEIKDCANIGKICSSYITDYEYDNPNISGVILLPWDAVITTNDKISLANCYNYGELSYEGELEHKIFAVTPYTSGGVSADNCYRLDTSCSDANYNTAHTAEQFKSGETGYRLNNGVTDGTQAWFQNIDNGKTPDDYPLPDKTRGTIYYIESENRYSNFPDGHNPDAPTEEPTAAPTEEPTQAPTEAPTQAPTEVPTQAPTEAPTEVPTQAPTTAPTEPSSEPAPSEHGIRNYEELCEFADLVNKGETNADAYLENNIIAPEDSEWTLGIGTADKPYNGTFDGKGYCIVGLRLYNTENAGLFEKIGSSGVVKDLMVFDCHSKAYSQNVGGIAAINEGTIDHCTSGINLAGNTTIKLPNGNRITPSQYNSYINGNYSGGVAAINNGTITGSRNGAVVDGTYCGGITAVNEGKLYGSANNGAVGSSSVSCQQSGGLAGENSGKIYSSYNSGKPSCGNSAAQGMIAGVNNSNAIRDVFYSDYNNVSAVGSSSTAALSDTSGLMKNTDMKSPKFVTTLNNVTDSTVTWTQTKFQDSYFNQGFPTIQGRYLNERMTELNKALSVSGMMHDDLSINAQAILNDSEEYAAFATQAEILSAFSVSTTDADGRYVPAEFWTAGGLQLTVSLGELAPTATDADDVEKHLVMLVQNDDGTIIKIAPDSVNDGKATFTVGEMRSFAIAMTSACPLGDADGDGKVTTIDATILQRFNARIYTAGITGDDLLARADVDGDGEISIIDVTLIQRYLANMNVNYPIGEYPSAG